MAKSNGRSVRGWILLGVSLAAIFAAVCMAWGGQRNTVAANKAGIEKLEEQQQTFTAIMGEVKIDVAQIRTILEEQAKREANPKRKENER